MNHYQIVQMKKNQAMISERFLEYDKTERRNCFSPSMIETISSFCFSSNSISSFPSNIPLIKGKSKARIYDEKGKKIKDVEVKELLEQLQKAKKKVSTIVFDGIITNRLVEAAEAKEVHTTIS